MNTKTFTADVALEAETLLTEAEQKQAYVAELFVIADVILSASREVEE